MRPRWLGLLLPLLLTPACPAATAQVGRVNTLWVVPALRHAWVEPLYAKRKPGGGLYLIDGLTVQRDIGFSARNAIAFLAAGPPGYTGFAAPWRRHDLYFYWNDPDQPRGGPSAGVGFAVAGYSAMLDLPVRDDVAVSGGIDSAGQVGAVGGVEFKIPAALAAGMRTLCLPAVSAPRVQDLTTALARRLRVVACDRAEQAFFEAFGLDGPEADRWDRVDTLYYDLFDAAARGEPVKARLAADELVELVPGDLSAQRLRLDYRHVDMTGAAANLFADAAQYDRDGLPDEALKTARRAWSYADETTRERHRALLERLEKSNLPAASRQILERAQALERDGDVGAAWRLVAELDDRHPDHPYLRRLKEQWTRYGAVSLLEEQTARRPDEPAGWSALARAYLEAGQPARAAETYLTLRRRQPDRPDWPAAQARALAAAERLPAAGEVLREMRGRWPAEADRTAVALGLELNPPRFEVSAAPLLGALASAVLRAVDESGPPLLAVVLDDRPEVTVSATGARLTIDLGRLEPGAHQARLSARDRFGNQTSYPLALTVPAPAPPAAGPTGQPGRCRLAPESAIRAATGTVLQFDGPAWSAGEQRVTEVLVNGVAVAGQAPFPVTLTVADGPRKLTIGCRLADGASPSRTVQLTGGEPPAWLASPAAGDKLTGTVPVVLAGPEAAGEWTLLVDDRPWRAPEIGGLRRLDTLGLAPGPHRLRALIRAGGRVVLSTELTVVTGPAGDRPEGEFDQDDLLPPPVPAAALFATGELTHRAVRLCAPPGAVRLVSDSFQPGPAPAAVSTALRLDGEPLPPGARLVLGVGDAVSFRSLADQAALGERPVLLPGPFVTRAWRPEQPGTYRLDLAAGPLVLRVEPHPPVALLRPPSGATLTAPTTFEVLLADLALRGLTLFDGGRVMGTWPAPSGFELDPSRMESGWHVLRLVAVSATGERLVSPPCAVEVP